MYLIFIFSPPYGRLHFLRATNLWLHLLLKGASKIICMVKCVDKFSVFLEKVFYVFSNS